MKHRLKEIADAVSCVWNAFSLACMTIGGNSPLIYAKRGLSYHKKAFKPLIWRHGTAQIQERRIAHQLLELCISSWQCGVG